MSDVDWRGVAMALGQLKDIAGPTELQKMKYQNDLAEGRAEDAREFASKEKQKDRMFNAATKKFEYLQGRHEKYQAEVATKESNILGISAAFDTLREEDKSPGTDFTRTTEDNEKTPLEQTQQNITNIEEDILGEIERLTYLTGAEKGMTFGKELRMTEGMAGASIFKEAGVDATYDYDQSGYVSKDELEEGLEQSIMMMEDQDLPTIGVREGYWSEFKGESARTQDELGAESDIISLARADMKLAQETYEATGGKGDLTEAEITSSYQEYYDLQKQLIPLMSVSKLSSKPKRQSTRITAIQKRVAELQLSLAREIGIDNLSNVYDNSEYFGEDEDFEVGSKKGVKGADKQWTPTPSGFITEDKYNQYLSGQAKFIDDAGGEFTPVENLQMNMQMASDMSFVMKNWKKGRKSTLRTSEQAKFDSAYDSIARWGHGNTY